MRFIKTAAAGCLAIAATGLAATPASADRPVEVEVTEVFVGVNPCSGEDHLVTVNRALRVHDHGRTVVSGHNSGTTSDGYVMDHGTIHIVSQGDELRIVINDQWRHDDGSKFRVHSRVRFDETTGELSVFDFDADCLGPSPS